MDKTNYKKRLEVCYHNEMLHSADSYYWHIAGEVYQHLIECNKSHHIENDKIECEWSKD